MSSFLEYLEKTCPGDDAHDGLGDSRPLLERCGMCREIYEEHQKEASARKILQDYQDEVHDWIKQFDPAYWTPHQILTHLTSELGELAKEINHEFGPLKKKPDEKESSVLEETGDIFFGLICLLNSQGKSMDAAFRKAMEKRRGRDKDRFDLAQKR